MCNESILSVVGDSCHIKGRKNRVLDQNILFNKNYKINLKTKLMPKIVRNVIIMDNSN